jgi:hypothetical protein
MMAEEAIKSMAGMQQYPTFIKPFQENLQRASEARGEIAGAREAMESQRSVGKEQAKSRVESDFAKKFAEAPQRSELEKISSDVAAPFIPTRDNAQSLAAIFMLTNIAGFAMGAGGKRNAQAAMSGMNGMLEGYQKGRQDLYKKEKDSFDTNIKQLKTRYDMLDRQLKEALETYKTDKEAGLREADIAYAQAGADFYKQYADKFGLAAMYEFHKQAYDSANKMWTEKNREDERARTQAFRETQEANRAAERARAQKIQEDAARKTDEYRARRLQQGEQGKAGGGVSGPGGAVQFRYNQAMTNAGLQLAAAVGNLADIPMKSAPPLLAETLTNPTKSISDSVVQFLGQKITQEDSRAMQQILAGMSRAITTIEASGRPSGATEASIKEFGKVSPRAGDAKINYYLFLAESKQVMEILVKDLIAAGANKEQVDFASKARDEVSKIVTWNVRDINRILASGRERLVNDRVKEQLQTSDRLSSINRMVSGMERSAAAPSAETTTSATPPATAPASRKEKARLGEQVFEDAKGNRAVKRNNQWVEVE